MDIGERIKQLRTKNELTLEELASRTELTKGFLSQLERNLVSPSIQTLEDVSEALGVTMSEFFHEEEKEQIVFTKADEFIDEQDDQTIHWIVPNAQKNEMEPIVLELKPNAQSKVIEPHHGEEMGYVLSGKINIVQGSEKETTTLNKGDTFYVRGDTSYYLENPFEKDACVLWVSTPPIF